MGENTKVMYVSAMYQVAPIFDIQCEHGERPIWDAVEQKLYWVDLLQGKYHKAVPATGKVETFSVGQPLGVLALRETGGLVMGIRDGFAFWDENTQALDFVAGGPEADNPETRFNDGAVDPAGRFFAGTMFFEGSKNIGKLYRLDRDQSVTILREEMLIPNGMGWSPDKKTFYLTDTLRNVIYAYDYEVETGGISNPRNFLEFDKNEYPDGMTVDSEGGFWVAMWEAGKICRFGADGKKIAEIPVPVTYPTSCCFWGADLKRLFITTSRLELDEKQRKEQPLAGRCFTLDTNVVGQLEPRFSG